MGTVTRIGHPSENEEKAVELSTPKLFDTPSKLNYHSSTGFGKSSQQSIAENEAAISHFFASAPSSPLLRYSLRRRSLPTVFPGRRCSERVCYCQKKKVVSHFDLPYFRRSSRRNECKADEESRTLYWEAPTRQRPARRLLHTLQFKSRKRRSCNLRVRCTRIDKADHRRSTAEENASYHTKRCVSK